MRIVDLQKNYRPGSGDWDWQAEYNDLTFGDPDRILADDFLNSIRIEGILEPVLLGNDGRIWDGHHRIVAAMILGIEDIPTITNDSL